MYSVGDSLTRKVEAIPRTGHAVYTLIHVRVTAVTILTSQHGTARHRRVRISRVLYFHIYSTLAVMGRLSQLYRILAAL